MGKTVDTLERQLYRVKWFFKYFRYISPNLVVRNKKPEYIDEWLIVYNNCDCLHQPDFKRAFNESLKVNDFRGLAGDKYEMRWRYYINCFFANQVKNLEGDFVECGVYKGGYAMAIIKYINFPALGKRFWLMDTFEGLALDHLTESEKARNLQSEYSHYEDCYESVKSTFKDLPVEIIKGTVPETLDQCKASEICYLSIDMNCSGPEIAAVNFFWDKIVSGGVIILDDYGFKYHIEQKAAFDLFAEEKKVSILQLPTGQGIIFKP